MEDVKTTVTLATIDPNTGKAPEARITSSMMVYQIAQRYRDSDQERGQKRAKVSRQLNGAAPYNTKFLEETGQSDKSNVAFREGEGHVQARKNTFYNLALDVPCLVTCKLNNSKIRDRDYAGTIAGKFDEMLKDWTGFMFNMMLHQDEMVVHGIGPVYWPDERNWKFEAMKNGNFLVDSGVKASVDDLPNCVIRGSYQAHELFWKVYATHDELDAGITDEQKRKAAEENGWNFDMVKKMIIQANIGAAAKKEDQYQTSIWETLQQQIKNNDTLYSSYFSEVIFVNHVFMREFRGKVSWYIVPEDNAETDYIFESKNKYNNFSEVLCLFFSNIGDGSYHSVKGLGLKIFSHCAVNDRLKNGMVDGTNLKNTLVVQGDISDVRRIKVGRCTVIPNNVKIVTNAFNPDIEGSIKVSEFMERSLARNVGTDRPDLDDHEGKGMETATGERLRLSREGKLERTDIMLYYQQLDALYKEIKRRVFLPGLGRDDACWESVQKFRKACLDAGVPESLLNNDAFTIQATRAIGFGSPAQARQIMSEVVSVAGHFPEVGKMNAVRDYVSVLVGHKTVDRYCPEDDSAKDPSNQTSFAVIENSMMEMGGQVAIGRDQYHIVHIEVHMEPLMEIAKQFVSTKGVGDNPLKVHDFFMTDLHHIAEHMDVIKDDPTRKAEYMGFMQKYDELTKVFGAISQMVQKLQKDLEDQRKQKQQQAQQQMDPKLQIELKKTEDDKQIALKKEADAQLIRESKANHSMQIKQMIADHKMAMDRMKGEQG